MENNKEYEEISGFITELKTLKNYKTLFSSIQRNEINIKLRSIKDVLPAQERATKQSSRNTNQDNRRKKNKRKKNRRKNKVNREKIPRPQIKKSEEPQLLTATQQQQSTRNAHQETQGESISNSNKVTTKKDDSNAELKKLNEKTKQNQRMRQTQRKKRGRTESAQKKIEERKKLKEKKRASAKSGNSACKKIPTKHKSKKPANKIKNDALVMFEDHINKHIKTIQQSAPKVDGQGKDSLLRSFSFLCGILGLCEAFCEHFPNNIENLVNNTTINKNLIIQAKSYRNAIIHYLIDWTKDNKDEETVFYSDAIIKKIAALYQQFFSGENSGKTKNNSMTFRANNPGFFSKIQFATTMVMAFPKITEFSQVLDFMENNNGTYKPYTLAVNEMQQFWALNGILSILKSNSSSHPIMYQHARTLVIILMGSIIQRRKFPEQEYSESMRAFLAKLSATRNYLAHGETPSQEDIDFLCEQAEKIVPAFLQQPRPDKCLIPGLG